MKGYCQTTFRGNTKISPLSHCPPLHIFPSHKNIDASIFIYRFYLDFLGNTIFESFEQCFQLHKRTFTLVKLDQSKHGVQLCHDERKMNDYCPWREWKRVTSRHVMRRFVSETGSRSRNLGGWEAAQDAACQLHRTPWHNKCWLFICRNLTQNYNPLSSQIWLWLWVTKGMKIYWMVWNCQNVYENAVSIPTQISL